MESIKIVLMILHAVQQRRHGHKEQNFGPVREGEGGMIFENGIEIYILA